jgi:hypothetical protein
MGGLRPRLCAARVILARLAARLGAGASCPACGLRAAAARDQRQFRCAVACAAKECIRSAFFARRGRRHRDLLEPERPPGYDRADRFGRGAATLALIIEARWNPSENAGEAIICPPISRESGRSIGAAPSLDVEQGAENPNPINRGRGMRTQTVGERRSVIVQPPGSATSGAAARPR